MTMSFPFSVGDVFKQGSFVEALVAEPDLSPAQSVVRPPDQPVLKPASPLTNVYHRYHIETQPAPDIIPLPSKFRVKVKKHRLITMIAKEFFESKGDLPVALSRP